MSSSKHPGVIDAILGYLSRCNWNLNPGVAEVEAIGPRSGSSLLCQECGPMEDEGGTTDRGQDVADQFEVVGIDTALLLEEKSFGWARRLVENLGKDRGCLILTF